MGVGVEEGHRSQRLLLGAVPADKEGRDAHVGQPVGALAWRRLEGVGHDVVVGVDEADVLQDEAVLFGRAKD